MRKGKKSCTHNNPRFMLLSNPPVDIQEHVEIFRDHHRPASWVGVKNTQVQACDVEYLARPSPEARLSVHSHPKVPIVLGPFFGCWRGASPLL